jgi:hypothetical protein
MKDKILKWFATGRVGCSSKAMACCFADIPVHDKSHPYDPDDLNRCLLLLKAVPEAREHMDKLKSLSETWSKLVDKWDEVEALFLDEVGLNWSKGSRAEKTYKLMRYIQGRD